jgi:hypothetical protein
MSASPGRSGHRLGLDLYWARGGPYFLWITNDFGLGDSSCSTMPSLYHDYSDNWFQMAAAARQASRPDWLTLYFFRVSPFLIGGY